MFTKDNRVLCEKIKMYGRDILLSDHHKMSDQHIQHGCISVRKHTINVAKVSLLFNERFHLNCNEKALVRGALLHDFFLYDWHDKDHINPIHLHGVFHPGIALRNAEKEFELTNLEREIIRKHMWPLTFIPPMKKEAWVVTMADKYASLLETLLLRKKKKHV